jgi:hypothetical protein|tara:strand:- start:12491 stop:12718 length:228 start_codon:yes stop_codon:yes gene_type:complete
MNTSNPEGSNIESSFFKISCDSSDESESESDTETETESETESSSSGESKPKMLKGYLKNTKKYKKILFEDTLFPE